MGGQRHANPHGRGVPPKSSGCRPAAIASSCHVWKHQMNQHMHFWMPSSQPAEGKESAPGCCCLLPVNSAFRASRAMFLMDVLLLVVWAAQSCCLGQARDAAQTDVLEARKK